MIAPKPCADRLLRSVTPIRRDGGEWPASLRTFRGNCCFSVYVSRQKTNIPELIRTPLPLSFFPGRHSRSAQPDAVKAFLHRAIAIPSSYCDVKQPDESGDSALTLSEKQRHSRTRPHSTLKCNTSGGGDRFSGRMMLRIGQQAATVPVTKQERLPCPRATAT